jgi:hypothetical protein
LAASLSGRFDDVLIMLQIIFSNYQCSAPASQHWSAPTTTQQKSIDFDHEIMENEKK